MGIFVLIYMLSLKGNVPDFEQLIYRLTPCSVYVLYFNLPCKTLTVLKMDKKIFAVNICLPNGMSYHRLALFQSSDAEI